MLTGRVHENGVIADDGGVIAAGLPMGGGGARCRCR